MGRFLNPDNRAFQDILNEEIYVDKTELLDYTNKLVNTFNKFICNSRPRRFGKSVTASMLVAYYSKGCDSKEMFSGLKIGSRNSFEKYLNKCDVIHFDVQWFIRSQNDVGHIVKDIQNAIIRELKDTYTEVVCDDTLDLPDTLSHIYEVTGKRFVIIIDEWDVLIREQAANQEVQNEYVEFLRRMFKGAEPTKFIRLAYLTGILPIKKLKTQSALNNFRQYTMINPGPLAKYIGFTEDEVKNLCVRYHRNFSKVKHWYDGYKLGEYHVYNPNAVASFMIDGAFQSYWSQTGTFESIRPYIDMDFDGLKTAIIEMISGLVVEVETSSFQNDMVSFLDKDDVLTLLIHLGYLAYDQERGTAYIPNEEIRKEFISATRRRNILNHCCSTQAISC